MSIRDLNNKQKDVGYIIRKRIGVESQSFLNLWYNKIVCFGSALLLLMMLTYCKSGTNKSSDAIKSIDTTSFVTSSDSSKQEENISLAKKDSIGNISFLLPSPDEILSEIFGDKMRFEQKLVSPKGNAKKYLNNRKLALNLGIYITDFAYLNLNDNKSGALEYFKVIRDMSQKVNIYGLFNENILNRLENNLTKKDSLNVISKEVYYNMLSILESSKRNNIYAMIACGALIESLYLSTEIVTNYADYQQVAQKIFEQKYVIANFYDFASQYDNDPDVKSMLVQVDNLKKILQGSGVNKTEKKVKKISKNQIEIKGGEDIVVTDKTFKIFKENVIKIRQDITNTSN